jgi:hypothetical protein
MLELQYDDLMNPTLQAMHELGRPASNREIETRVAKILHLSEEQIKDLHRGTTTKLVYRLAWTRNYLKRYGLLKKIARGVWTLTSEGQDIPAVDKEEVKRSVKNGGINHDEDREIEEDAIGELDNDESEEDYIDPTAPIMERPFDPTKIDIDTKTPSLDILIKRIRSKTVELNTESYFQRKDDLWDVVKQSRLIESILIRFPLPAFFFDATDDNKWLVVDGLQRLSSIRNFVVNESLKLTNLEFLTHLNGKKWSELPSDLQRLIEESQVVIYKIMPGTPTDVKFNIFKRINTGGLILEAQEIRHALFQGKPANFIAELAAMPEFKDATDGKIKGHRMLDRDYANRFLGFYLYGFENYFPDLDTFMSKAMSDINNLTDFELDQIRKDFRGAMTLAKDIFGKEAFRKIYGEHDRLPPINKAIFDALSVQFAVLSESDRSVIANKKNEFKRQLREYLNSDEYFFVSVTSSTGDKNRVLYRHRMVKSIIDNVLEYDSIN